MEELTRSKQGALDGLGRLFSPLFAESTLAVLDAFKSKSTNSQTVPMTKERSLPVFRGVGQR